MAGNDFIPSSFAGAMQLRTRKKNKFDEVESNLPDPRVPRLEASQALSLSGLLTWLGNLNPFGRAVTSDDIVWLLDNTAFQSAPRDGSSSSSSPWQAEFVTAVFEREAKGRVADMVTSVVRAVGLADDAEQRKTVEKRVMPFLWDVRPARTITAVQARPGTQLSLGPTNVNGLSSNVLQVPSSKKGSLLDTSTRLGGGEGAILDMQNVLCGTRRLGHHFWCAPQLWPCANDEVELTEVRHRRHHQSHHDERPRRHPPRNLCQLSTTHCRHARILRRDEVVPAQGHRVVLPLCLPLQPLSVPQAVQEAVLPTGHPDPQRLELEDGGRPALGPDVEYRRSTRWTACARSTRGCRRGKMIVIGDSTQSDPEAYGEM